MTPKQIEQITDNLNHLVELANYDVKVTFSHRLWWLQGFGENGLVVSLMSVDNDDQVEETTFTDEELQSMAVEVLAQVTLGA